MNDSNEGQTPEEQMRAEFEKSGYRQNETMREVFYDVWQACAAQSAEKIARMKEAKVSWIALCNKASERNDELLEQLAAAQADNLRLQQALLRMANALYFNMPDAIAIAADKIRARPVDTSALDAYVAKKMAWQPIETVPRDGSRVIVLDRTGHVGIAAYYNVVKFELGVATHWMPLPPAPTNQDV